MIPILLRNRDFRLFVGGLSFSVFGSEFTTVAMAWQIYLLTDSPLDIGLLGLARAVPQMALLLLGGLLADAFDRRRLMMAVQAAQFLVSAGLFACSLAGAITPAVLFVAAGLLAGCTALEQPCRQALIPNLVPTEQLSSAVALTNALRKIGSIVGPSLAGLVLAFADPSWCYLVDASSWALMLAVLTQVRIPIPNVSRGSISLGALQEGLRFVVTHPVILALMSLDFAATLFGAPQALFPVFARDILNAGPQGLGLLYASLSVGAIVGGLGMAMVHDVRRAGMAVLAGVGVFGLAGIGFAVSPVLWVSAVMLAISGIGNAMSAVLRWTVVQVLTPDELRGRVASVSSIFTNGGPRLGEFRGGLTAELWGAQMSALTGGVATLLVVAAVALLPSVRSFRLPGPDEQGPDVPAATPATAAR